MSSQKFSPPFVDNRFGFDSPSVYQQVIEPSFDWDAYRRTFLQFEKAESLHNNRIYDQCGCSVVSPSRDTTPCLAHAAHLYAQTKIDETLDLVYTCPCMFCRKNMSERDRPPGARTEDELKQQFLLRDRHAKKTVTYLSRPASAPFRHTSFSLSQTSAPRYIPTLRHVPQATNAQVGPAVGTHQGMRLDAEPYHNHSQMYDQPRERDATFRSLDDYFHMTSHGRPTMIL